MRENEMKERGREGEREGGREGEKKRVGEWKREGGRERVGVGVCIAEMADIEEPVEEFFRLKSKWKTLPRIE